jgi:hypothetical protein
MKRVYIAFYDGRVAGVFDTWQKCEKFVEMRVPGYTGQGELQPFGTKFEYDDERGNHHEWWSCDYEVE